MWLGLLPCKFNELKQTSVFLKKKYIKISCSWQSTQFLLFWFVRTKFYRKTKNSLCVFIKIFSSSNFGLVRKYSIDQLPIVFLVSWLFKSLIKEDIGLEILFDNKISYTPISDKFDISIWNRHIIENLVLYTNNWTLLIDFPCFFKVLRILSKIQYKRNK